MISDLRILRHLQSPIHIAQESEGDSQKRRGERGKDKTKRKPRANKAKRKIRSKSSSPKRKTGKAPALHKMIGKALRGCARAFGNGFAEGRFGFYDGWSDGDLPVAMVQKQLQLS